MNGSSSYLTGSTLFFEATKEAKWTAEENKRFEDALALFDKETPERWHNVARLVPGKTVSDVMNQYKRLEEDVSDIEAGVLVAPGYTSDQVTLEWIANNHSQFYSLEGKRRVHDQEKKKGIPWTEEEHRQFLLGLKKYGKGDWRNISRNFVTSRTPTQVASHAQKYFIRQLSSGKDKRRSSIHDITTVNLSDTTMTTTTTKTTAPQSNSFHKPDEHMMTTKAQHHHSMWANVAFNLPNSNLMMAPHHGSSSYGPQYGQMSTVFQGKC